MSEDKTPSFPPRQGDLPRDQIIKMAQDVITKNCDVYFKFTCPHCGTRCSFNEKNRLYEEGECCKCGKKSKVDFAGFSLHIRFGNSK